jgi:parallel beta-helix repeat protein
MEVRDMGRLIMVCVVSVLLLTSVCLARTWYVTLDDGSGDAVTIQAGIDSASAGDTVMVHPGTYVENIDFLGKTIVVTSEYGPDSTVIDGNQAGSVVTFSSGETVNSVLEGFTITNGSGTYFDSYWEYGGGGIFCSGSAPTIQYNVITGNAANNGGGIGAVYVSPVVITHNVIFENSANVTPGRIGGGGAMAIAYSSDAEVSHNDMYDNYSGMAGGAIAFGFDCDPKVMNNTISNNVANDYGGGIQIYSNTAGTFENNTIMGNSSLGSRGAGGISCRLGSHSVIANNVITDNSCVTYGGGIRCFDDATATIINNLIFGNGADISGGGIDCSRGGFATVTNTILWNNHAPAGTEIWVGPRLASPAVLTISYSDVEGGMDSVYVVPGSTLNWGAGMIDNNPLFRSPGANDFHLMAIACGDSMDSPCIDVGDPAIIDSLLDCSWGLGTILSDLGAYGGGDSVQAGIGDQKWGTAIPRDFSLSQNYLNPFSIETVIRYSLPEGSLVDLSVYDVTGRLTATLVDGKVPGGRHHVTWDGTDSSGKRVASGLYFVRLKAGGFVDTKKMMLLR